MAESQQESKERLEREAQAREAKRNDEPVDRRTRVDCERCGATYSVRNTQAERQELHDCPVCRFRHIPSPEAVEASLKN